MKTLISAQTVRDAQATGRCCLPAGKDVLITPEARGLADQLGIRLDSAINDLSVLPACCARNAGGTKEVSEPRGDDDLAALRSAVLAKLPADAAKQPALVEQVMQKVRAAQTADAAAHSWPAAGGGIKLVKEGEIRLGIFEGAGAEKEVGIADVITAADGAPLAAGFMAWSESFFPWTLDYDEVDLVLEGELHIRCDGQTFVGKAGDVLYIPKGSAIEFGTPGKVRFFYVTYPANWQG